MAWLSAIRVGSQTRRALPHTFRHRSGGRQRVDVPLSLVALLFGDGLQSGLLMISDIPTTPPHAEGHPHRAEPPIKTTDQAAPQPLAGTAHTHHGRGRTCRRSIDQA